MLLHKPTLEKMRDTATQGMESLPRIVMSSRVRLARNLQGERFPDWASGAERIALLQRIGPLALQAIGAEGATLLTIGDLDARARDLLVERWLISRDLAERVTGGGVVIARNGAVSIMVNEEDHIRIQAISPGLNVTQSWQAADAIDTRLDHLLPYAFSRRLGYLTACPSNIGTGMRASVMVHLPGLRLTGDIDPVIQGLERLCLTVRGIGGEGSAAAGHRFQISNQGTLGQDEQTVIATLERVAEEIAHQEALARLRALRDLPLLFEDCLSRALALLRHAKLLQTEEALDYLSAVRMGVEMGMIRGITPDKLAQLELAVQPGHLQEFLQTDLDAESRDVRRAETLNEHVQDCTVDARRIQATAKRMSMIRENT